MKYFKLLALVLICLITVISYYSISFSEEAEDTKYGSLSIYSKLSDVSVYIDNELVGKAPVEIEKIQVGTHLVVATSDDKTVYEEVVYIKEGEVTTILITEQKIESKPGKKAKKESREEAYPPSIQGGPFLKVGFTSSLIYSLNPYGADAYSSSTLCLGGGYKLSLLPSLDLPSVDIMLSFERGDFVSGGESWFLMPIMIGLNFNYPIIPGFGGKQYMALGIGYIITNIRIGGEELSCVGYSIIPYGIEFPVADSGSVFIETYSAYAENGKHKYALESFSVGGGYRWIF